MKRVGLASVNVVPLQRHGELPDAALVVEARQGNREAGEALFRRHAGRVMALAYRLAPEEEPEDIAQDVFVKALGQLRQLQQPGAFGGWLAAITVSLVRMRLRRRRWLRRLGLARGEPIDPDGLTSRDAPEEVRVELRDLYRAVQRLKEEERVALVLQRVEGLDLAEVADRMGLSVATVKRRIVVAERALREVKSDG